MSMTATTCECEARHGRLGEKCNQPVAVMVSDSENREEPSPSSIKGVCDDCQQCEDGWFVVERLERVNDALIATKGRESEGYIKLEGSK